MEWIHRMNVENINQKNEGKISLDFRYHCLLPNFYQESLLLFLHVPSTALRWFFPLESSFSDGCRSPAILPISDWSCYWFPLDHDLIILSWWGKRLGYESYHYQKLWMFVFWTHFVVSLTTDRQAFRYCLWYYRRARSTIRTNRGHDSTTTNNNDRRQQKHNYEWMHYQSGQQSNYHERAIVTGTTWENAPKVGFVSGRMAERDTSIQISSSWQYQ